MAIDVTHPFQARADHDATTETVSLYQNGQLVETTPVATPGQAGTVRVDYPHGLPAADYEFIATAHNATGDSPPSNAVVIAQSPPPPVPTPPTLALVPLAPPASGLLQPSDFQYVGAFRVPSLYDPDAKKTFAWGGTGLTFWRDSLLLVGHDWHQYAAEVGVVTPQRGASLTDLPIAPLRQDFVDPLQDKLFSVDGDTSNGVKIGAFAIVNQQLAVCVWTYYDNGQPPQTKTHFLTGQNFATLTPAEVLGPFQVGTGVTQIGGSDITSIGGFVSGYMCPVPPEWQAALGGTHLSGQGGGVSVLARTSSGPSATVCTLTDLGTPAAIDHTAFVMGYPHDHPTQGVWGEEGGLYNGTQNFRGMIFPPGTRSVLFIGWGGTQFCYGAGTDDPALHFQPHPAGGHYCYDPVDHNKGTHGYPNRSLVWAYDVEDFIRAKNGQVKPWDIAPYATWSFSLPFQERLVNGVDEGIYDLVGAAFDPATHRLYLSAFRQEGDNPVIHVLQLVPPARRGGRQTDYR